MARRWMLAVLCAATLASAVAVVYSRHETRKAFARLQTLETQRDQAQMQWSRLQLEQATLGRNSRVEDLAKRKLAMHQQDPKAVELIRE